MAEEKQSPELEFIDAQTGEPFKLDEFLSQPPPIFADIRIPPAGKRFDGAMSIEELHELSDEE